MLGGVSHSVKQLGSMLSAESTEKLHSNGMGPTSTVKSLHMETVGLTGDGRCLAVLLMGMVLPVKK